MSMLCVLSGCVLRHTFPDLDDFQIAQLYDKQKHDESASVESLFDLCKAAITSINPNTNLEDLINGKKKTASSSKNIQSLDYSEYLKKLALTKTSVVLPKLQDEIIQLWTKQHWSFLDPYSDIEEALSSPDSGDTNSEGETVQLNKNDETSAVIGGRVLRRRKRNYLTSRPHRSHTKHQYYRGLCADTTPNRKKTGGNLLPQESFTC